MKMTIKEALEKVETIFEELEDEYSTGEDLSKEHEAMNLITDIINKYQKIEEILDDWRSDGGALAMTKDYYFRLISEVVEDGSGN